MTKRYDEAIEVEVGMQRSNGVSTAEEPSAFSWRGRRYAVSRVLKYWREAGQGWDPERISDHECFRVEAEGGTYDLRHDRVTGPRQRWRLSRVWD